MQIANGLFDVIEGRPRLIAARRKADGAVAFPAPQGPDAELFERFHLAPRGRLWSFTVQRFRPKSPPYDGAETAADFEPFALGYVEIPDEIIVETRIVVSDFDKLRIGMDMELVAVPFRTASRGDVTIYAFQPVGEDR